MKTLTVSELTQNIKKLLETNFSFLSIKGEISNLKVQASGHYYFTLKDDLAQISSVLFKGNGKNLSRPPKEGDQVVASGEVSVYSPRGQYQLLVRTLDYLGKGELLLQLYALKEKLARKGWFDSTHKKPLPKYPKRIGVITSPTGAVIQDIVHVLSRRSSGFHLILHPVKVQGEGAAAEIALAIAQMNTYRLADVLIVGRGGGSLEDLWAFNEELVVEAIFQSTIPIISAVGHETDVSLADFVADLRAPTPSAAAEIVLSETSQQVKFLQNAAQRMQMQVSANLSYHRQKLASFAKSPYVKTPNLLLSPFLQKTDRIKMEIKEELLLLLERKKHGISSIEKQLHTLKPSNKIENSKQQIAFFAKNLQAALHLKISSLRKKVEEKPLQKTLDDRLLFFYRTKKQGFLSMVSHLQAIDPKNLFTKGYCILFSEKKDSVILSTKEVTPKQKLQVQLKDGTIKVVTEEIFS